MFIETSKPALLLGGVFALTFVLQAAPSNESGAAGALPPGAVARLKIADGSALHAVAFAPDGKTLASAGADTLVRLWDPATGKELRQLGGHTEAVRALAFAPDGKMLASTGEDWSIRLWHTETGKDIGRLDGHEGMVLALAFAPDGKTLASASGDQTIRLWQLAHRKKSLHIAGSGRFFGLAYTADGKGLASANWDGSLSLWRTSSGSQVQRLLRHQGLVLSLALAPDDSVLASSSEDRSVRLWSLAVGKELRRCEGHAGWVRSVVFAPDGNTLASASEDRTVRLWETASGKEICKFDGHEAGVWSLAFAPDGKTLASAAADGTMLLWDIRRLGRDGRTEKLADKDLAQMWTALADDDAAPAYQAIADLADAPGQALPFLQQQLRPKAEDPRRLTRLVADLDSDHFQARRRATEELRMIGARAAPALHKALAANPPLEVRRRLEYLLEALPALSPEELRLVRVVHVLERVASAEARQLLQTLAGGTEGTRLVHDAQAALTRVAKRAGPH